MNKPTFAFTGIFIPSHIWTQPALQVFDKVIWAVVSHWHDGDSICTATDEEIASFLGENDMLVTASVMRLNALGYIHMSEAEDGKRSLWTANVIVVEKEKPADVAQATPDDVQRVVDLYNEHCGKVMPRAEKITPTRMKRIRVLLKEMGEDALKALFVRCAASSFLSGRSKQWTGCNIDWILAPSNLTRVLEGVFDDRRITAPRQLPANLR